MTNEKQKSDRKLPYKGDKANRHSGHRERMKERHRTNSLNGFSDHEILEMVLFRCLPQGNTNEIAHRLLDEFGTLDRVFSADVPALMTVNGIKEQSAWYLKFLFDVFRRVEQCRIRTMDMPDAEADNKELLRHLFGYFYGLPTEHLLVIFLDAAGRVVSSTNVGNGITNKVDVSMKTIVREVSKRSCDQIVIAHNHPNGILIASEEDLLFTSQLAQRLNEIGANLIAHYLIVDKDYLVINRNYQYRMVRGAYNELSDLFESE